MKTPLVILAAIVLAFSQMGGCATTGTTGSDFWNSPVVQSEMAFLEKIGTDALNAWIQSQLPSHPMAKRHAVSKEVAINNAIAEAEQKCPDLPKEQVAATIRAKFAAKK